MIVQHLVDPWGLSYRKLLALLWDPERPEVQLVPSLLEPQVGPAGQVLQVFLVVQLVEVVEVVEEVVVVVVVALAVVVVVVVAVQM